MNDASGVTWLAQALGITAFAISLVGYLSPCDRRMKIMMTAGTALLSLQFVLFGGWLLALLFAGGYFFLSLLVDARIYLAVFAVIFGVGVYLCNRWLDRRGAVIFSEL